MLWRCVVNKSFKEFKKIDALSIVVLQPAVMAGLVEAHRALELLEDYHAKLTRPQDKQLRLAIERVIRIFKSRLFQALLGFSP
ncbi:hypothetical protein KM043_015808 [Ampulex compressa]|nr:hypothetical protein KM043_015808 [Ampulex compressa]